MIFRFERNLFRNDDENIKMYIYQRDKSFLLRKC